MKSTRHFRLPFLFLIQTLAIFFVLRIALLITNWNDVAGNTLAIARCLLLGLRMDIAIATLFSTPFFVFLAVIPARFFERPAFRTGLRIVYFSALYTLVFFNIADYFFFDEFNSRFNYIAIDYIFVSPREVVENIWQSYPVPAVLLLNGFLTWIFSFGSNSYFTQASTSAPAWRTRAAGAALTIVLGVGLVRSIDIRTMNDNPNRILAEIGANGFYTLGYALLTNHMDYDAYYMTMDEKGAFENVRQRIIAPDQKSLNNPDNPLERTIPAQQGFGKANVVIVLEESLGSKFVGVLRHPDMDLTPNLDRLSKLGLWFPHMYSTGTRTVRALEAVLTSFPPIPGASIVKRNQSKDLTSIARILKAVGYHTVFVYGGRGMFDSMKPFMMNNGFQRFIEQSDYTNPTFTTAWGVADEDIFNKAIETFDDLEKQRTPFFATILTVSNHKPYSYPDKRIDLDPRARSRNNAVKYADWALGQFFEQAKSHAFFNNTIFVVLGDHGARVYGADFIPIESYEIPLLIYAPHLIPKPRVIPTVACSIDVAPTILGLLGVEYKSTFFGRDILRMKPEDGYALLQHDRDVGLLKNGRLAILSTKKEVSAYTYDALISRFTKTKTIDLAREALIRDTVSIYQTAYALYSRGHYRVTGQQ